MPLRLGFQKTLGGSRPALGSRNGMLRAAWIRKESPGIRWSRREASTGPAPPGLRAPPHADRGAPSPKYGCRVPTEVRARQAGRSGFFRPWLGCSMGGRLSSCNEGKGSALRLRHFLPAAGNRGCVSTTTTPTSRLRCAPQYTVEAAPAAPCLQSTGSWRRRSSWRGHTRALRPDFRGRGGRSGAPRRRILTRRLHAILCALAGGPCPTGVPTPARPRERPRLRRVLVLSRGVKQLRCGRAGQVLFI
jgi:hypothetical protein